MRITLAKKSQQRLLKKMYVPVKTTFVTEDGPAIGTIWFCTFAPDRPPLIVEDVDSLNGVVHFDGGANQSIGSFLNIVRDGNYILIGVAPDTYGHTVL